MEVEPIVGTASDCYPVRLTADDVEEILRRILRRDAVATVPRRHRQADLDREWWDRYVDVNRRFAGSLRAPRRRARCGSRLQLQLVPKMLRSAPGPDDRLLLTSPSRRSNFPCRCRGAPRSPRAYLAPTLSGSVCPAARRTSSSWPGASSAPTPPAPRSVCPLPVRRGLRRLPDRQGRRVPDLDRLRRPRPESPPPRHPAAGPRNPRRTRRSTKILLGVDRLDYTKGIDVRLQAFGELSPRPASRATTRCWCSWPPSRERVESYRVLRTMSTQVRHMNTGFR